jgi:hypothetical protein
MFAPVAKYTHIVKAFEQEARLGGNCTGRGIINLQQMNVFVGIFSSLMMELEYPVDSCCRAEKTDLWVRFRETIGGQLKGPF